MLCSEHFRSFIADQESTQIQKQDHQPAEHFHTRKIIDLDHVVAFSRLFAITPLFSFGNLIVSLRTQKSVCATIGSLCFRGLMISLNVECVSRLMNFSFSLASQELQKHNVSTVVRVCEPSYKKDVLEGAGIEVRDLAYEDGTFPPPNIVDEWFEVLKQK